MINQVNEVSLQLRQTILQKLSFLYGSVAEEIFNEIMDILELFAIQNPKMLQVDKSSKNPRPKISHRDIILNTYSDSIIAEPEPPLKVLYRFADKYLKDIKNGVHLLPFYPWDTDRGFSVSNYYEVDPRNGSWADFTALKEVFSTLMVDVVINHASINNPIVQKSLLKEGYNDFVILFTDKTKPTKEELSKISRARSTPVLTRYRITEDDSDKKKAILVHPKDTGDGWIWTTFSRPDNQDGSISTRQVDLNFRNPKVFLEFLRILLYYIERGATWIRLDAIGYIWKDLGTNCLHLPQAHTLIQLYSNILEFLEPLSIVLIAEVNEPQEKTIPYLGLKDTKESDMIYLFTHFPLAVHAILSGTSKYYMNWLPSLIPLSGKIFTTVLGTHDGMGQKPISNWLPEAERKFLQNTLVKEHGALPNYSFLPGNKKIIYEICATPWSIINPRKTDLSETTKIARYMAVFALGLMIKGVPSIYINGLLGIPNYEGKLDENRSINRQQIKEEELFTLLDNKNSINHRVLQNLLKLIRMRQQEKSFEFEGDFTPIPLHTSLVSILLSSADKKSQLLAIVNISDKNVSYTIEFNQLGWNSIPKFEKLYDMISETNLLENSSDSSLHIECKPYQIYWIKAVPIRRD